jgi:membrane-associated protein
MFDIPHLIETVGYLGLFGIIFAESGVFIGIFLPGDSLLFTAGILSSQGYLNIWILLPLFFAAGYLGDLAGYFIGRSIGPRIFSRPKSFWFNPENVEKTKRFYDKYGKKTVIIARFIPIVRTIAPVMAGVGEMRYETFMLYNGLGALCWGVGITALGYFFGNVIPNADHYLLPIIAAIVAISFIPAIIEFLRSRKGR